MTNTCFTCNDPAGDSFFDVGNNLVDKQVLIENYPWLACTNNAGASVLWTFGRNTYGRLGDNTSITKSSPVQTIAAGTAWRNVSGGSYHAMATKSDGTLWAWGRSDFGQLGDSSTVNKSSPVQTISAGTNWKFISAACCHSAATKTDGSLWLWGGNLGGRLGDNSTAGNLNRSSPVQTVGNALTWKTVNIFGRTSAALKMDGSLWNWGCNACGSLGINLAFAATGGAGRSSPVQTIAAGATNWTKVSTSGYTTGAITRAGVIWMWGDNLAGQLGNLDQIDRSSPVQIVGTNTGWSSVSLSRNATIALCSGILHGWGDNGGGINGYGAFGGRLVQPTKSIFDQRFTYINAGRCHAAGITNTGELWLWGYNCAGMFGNNNSIGPYGSPVRTISGGNNWRSVSPGLNFTVAIQDVADE